MSRGMPHCYAKPLLRQFAHDIVQGAVKRSWIFLGHEVTDPRDLDYPCVRCVLRVINGRIDVAQSVGILGRGRYSSVMLLLR